MNGMTLQQLNNTLKLSGKNRLKTKLKTTQLSGNR